LNNLLVMKFGGTSMGSAERMQVAAKLTAEQQNKRPVAIVVSAMSKITDLLLDTLQKAEAGDAAAMEINLSALTSRHLDCCTALLPEDRQTETRERIDHLIGEFSRISHGVLLLQDRPLKSVDEAIAIGERLSSTLVAAHLNSEGVMAEAVNAAEVIATDAVFGNATPLLDETRERAAKVLRPLLEKGVVPVVTGFNASTLDGRPTTLGRGGSDFSASILASVLDAAELWIWTDVDGIMSADPRLVKNPRVLSEVTYAEAAELAYAGAKVLHPRTLAPLAERKIPVWSKNSFAVEKPGTRIVPKISAGLGPRAVTSMTSIAMVSLEPADSGISGTRVMSEAIEALSRAGVEVLLMTSSSYTQSFCFLVRLSELDQTREALEEALELEITHGYLKPLEIDTEVGLVAVVGEGMRGTPGLAGRIFTAISRHNINIIAIAQGSSELTIAIVIHRKDLEQAVRSIHEECGMGQKT
jgi:bifunctional aspartokinase / homoserine dehydrogenase 1